MKICVYAISKNEQQFAKRFIYSNLTNVNQEHNQGVYGFADMHHVRPQLKKTLSDPKEVLLQSILDRRKNTEFWRQ